MLDSYKFFFNLCYIKNALFKTDLITYRNNLWVSLYLLYFMYVIYCKLNTDIKVVITIPVVIDVTICNRVFGGTYEVLIFGIKSLDFASIILLRHSESKLLSV